MYSILARRLATLFVAGLIAVLPVAVASPAEAAVLRCIATVSDATPKQYTTVVVRVRTGKPRAYVRTVAHYKTTRTVKKRRSNLKGQARVPYYISGATPGYRVRVTVRVRKNGQTKYCSTSFTPHR